MICAERRPDGGPCRRAAVAAVDGAQLVTVLCEACTARAARLVPGLQVRWLRGHAAPGGARTLSCLTY